MSATPLIISCPYCRRQYTMKLDRAEIERDKRRATCGRCGNSFELASRIVVPGSARLAPTPPPLPRGVSPRPARPTPGAMAAVSSTPSPSKDPRSADMDDLTRDIMAAAESITGAPSTSPDTTTNTSSAASDIDDRTTGEFSTPQPTRRSNTAINTTIDPTRVATPIASAGSSSSGTSIASANGQGSEGDTAPFPKQEAEDAEVTATVLAVEPKGHAAANDAVPAASWIDLADPGLARLSSPSSAACIALDRALN